MKSTNFRPGNRSKTVVTFQFSLDDRRLTMFAKIIILFACFAGFNAKNVNYDVEMNKFEFVRGDGDLYFDPGTVRLSRMGRNHFAISGNFEFLENLGENVVVSSIKLEVF